RREEGGRPLAAERADVCTHPSSLFPLLGLVAMLAWAVRPAAEEPEGDGLRDPGYLRTLAETRGFMLGRPSGARPTPDGAKVLFLRAGARVPQLSLFEFDVATRRTRELLTPERLLKGAEERLSAEEKARRERM